MIDNQNIDSRQYPVSSYQHKRQSLTRFHSFTTGYVSLKEVVKLRMTRRVMPQLCFRLVMADVYRARQRYLSSPLLLVDLSSHRLLPLLRCSSVGQLHSLVLRGLKKISPGTCRLHVLSVPVGLPRCLLSLFRA